MRTFALLFILALSQALAGPNLDFSAIETAPIQDGGRKKPFSTFATETVQILHGRASYSPKAATLRAQAERWNAMEIVTAMWLGDGALWREEPMLLLNYKPLKLEMGLDEKVKHFSHATLISNKVFLGKLNEVQTLRQRDPNAKLNREQQEVTQVANRMSLLESLLRGDAFAMVPNPQGGESRWATAPAATSMYPGEAGETVEAEFQALKTSYQNGDFEAEPFVKAVASLAPDKLPPAWLLELEHGYFALHPFRVAWILFAAACTFLLVTGAVRSRWPMSVGWLIVLVGLAFMIYGFAARILISGRAPVTNMYESVIWVAFGTIFFALIFAAIYRSKTFLLAACPLAVFALILADSQPTVLNPGIHPLVPVLRDNFWLTTHVLSITLSYAAFMLALGVAHMVLGNALIGRKSSPVLHNYLYRCIQIGVLLLGTGTILGGVWANYSWGRFWDWDPKETWALIAFLAYIFLLHGRIAGYWGGFGLAVGSVIGFMCVVMAWYGVNFVLGAGLHSYGFGTGGFGIVIAVVIAELLFTAAAVVRARMGLTSSSHTPA